MSAAQESKKDPIAKYRAKFWSSDVSVEHISSTPGTNRYLHRRSDPDHGEPYLLSWRNNLTVLSQRFNLYIVAFEDELHVSRLTPSVPSLAPLARSDTRVTCIDNTDGEPPMQIRLAPSRPALPGHMPGSRPHSFNNLIVADLGEEEIICIACDDGDVMAVYTHSIEHMMEETERKVASNDDLQPGLTPPLDVWDRSGQLRALLHVNLGASVWGLAVHKEGRLIAASCNDHSVYVFAPAMSTDTIDVEQLDNRDCPEVHAHWTLSPYHVFLDAYAARDTNRYKKLEGHETNIPCITFDHSHLVSTDIAGYTIVWDLDCGTPVAEMHPHHNNPHDYDATRSGWGLACLDRRTFRPAKTIVSALGACEVATADDVFLVDISHSKELIQGNKRWNIERPNRPTADPPGDNGRNEDASDDESSTPGLADIEILDNADQSDFPVLSSAAEKAVHILKGNSAGKVAVSAYNNISAMDCEDTGCFPFFFCENETFTAGSPWDHPQQALRHNTSPLLLVNPHAVHLLQSTDVSLHDGDDPVIYISDPLEQHCRPDLALQLSSIDRMNLVTQIPELGIVLIGSAKGRVAILSLHRLGEEVYSFNENSEARPYTYTMRLEAILPLSEQEEEGERPMNALAGLAAAPIQGHDNRIDGQQRWRVVLTYRDHTVLSYEVQRDPGITDELKLNDMNLTI